MLAKIVLLYVLLETSHAEIRCNQIQWQYPKNDSAEDSGVTNVQVDVYAGKDTEDKCPVGTDFCVLVATSNRLLTSCSKPRGYCDNYGVGNWVEDE